MPEGAVDEWGGRSSPEASLLLPVAHHHLQPPAHPPQHLVPPRLLKLLRTPAPAAPPSRECPAASVTSSITAISSFVRASFASVSGACRAWRGSLNTRQAVTA